MKRITRKGGIVAAAAVLAGALAACPPALAAGDTSWYSAGAASYTIKNSSQLAGLSDLVNAGTTFEGKTITLTANITRSSSLVPIGTAAHPFQGTFDGGGHDITFPKLDAGGSLANVGMFGYAGDKAVIKNFDLKGGSVEVTNSAAGKRISGVGAVAGYLGGSIENVSSTTDVTVTNDGTVPQSEGKTTEDQCIILGVGGLVGYLGGDMTGCEHDADLVINSKSDVSTTVPYIAGFVGGLAGHQGSETNPAHVTNALNCTNAGAITFNVNGAGGVDRFGSKTYSKSAMVGGIVGYTMGNVKGCSNGASIQTGVVKDGAVQAGWGASDVGGIVGALRGPGIAEAASSTGVVGANATDPGYDVWLDSKGAKKAELISIEQCSNTGKVTGLASVAGICGSGGAFTKIEGCSNTATIEGTRWNKPCPAGIVGIMNGDIRYCYNQGRCFSTTGGGYYAAGICALLTTYNTSSTSDEMLLDLPELCACYVTGTIGGTDSGYRTGVLAGENDGYIHDNVFAPNLTADKETDSDIYGDSNSHSALVSKGQNRGTLANNHELSVAQMKTSLAVSYLNKPNAKKSDWSLYYVPVSGKNPLLSWQAPAVSDPTDISTVVTGLGEVTHPEYSSGAAAVPSVPLKTSSVELYQDADYKVVVDPANKEVGSGYQATIVGINNYTGTLATKVTYNIVKANIANCKVRAQPVIFNWKRQAPSVVTVIDDSGNLVDTAEYTFTTLPNADGSTKKVDGKYYDYINCHGEGYKYDVKVDAKGDSKHFYGSTTQAAFRIRWASLMFSTKKVDDPNREETAVLGDVVWNGQSWDIGKALDTKGYVKIKYTGAEIKPTCKTVTYLGVALRDGTGKPYYDAPLDYDFMYIYGNPNPEDGKDLSKECVDVTGSKETDLACMTVRFTTGGNFDNYTNVFYEITPADMASDVKVGGIAASYPYTGKAVKVAAKLTYNGMTLAEGTDYTVSYKDNVKAGTAKVTFTGKGNYAGSATKSFKIAKASIAKASAKVAKQGYTGKALKPVPTVKLNGVKLKKGTDYTVTYKNNKKIGTASFTVKGKGNYKGTKKGTFKIVKGAQPLKLKAATATVKYKKVKKKAQTVALKVAGAKGKLSYKNASKGAKLKKFKVSSTGKVTVPKGVKKGTYKVKVKVTAKATKNFKKTTKTLTLKIAVK